MMNDGEHNADFDGKVDLSPLDPQADPAEYELALDRIRQRVAPILAARIAPADVWSLIATWQRPVLASCGVLVSAVILFLLIAAPREHVSWNLTDTLGLPANFAALIDSGHAPTPAAVLDWEESR